MVRFHLGTRLDIGTFEKPLPVHQPFLTNSAQCHLLMSPVVEPQTKKSERAQVGGAKHGVITHLKCGRRRQHEMGEHFKGDR